MSLQSVGTTVVPLYSKWSLIIIIMLVYRVLYNTEVFTFELSWLNAYMISHWIGDIVHMKAAFSMQKCCHIEPKLVGLPLIVLHD